MEYNSEEDKRLHDSYDQVKRELDTLKKSPKWSSAMLFELYWFEDMTYDELASTIKISKSTAFLNTRKVKEHLKNVVENPFTSSKN